MIQHLTLTNSMELIAALADNSYSFSQEISLWNTTITVCTAGLNIDERHRNFSTNYFGNLCNFHIKHRFEGCLTVHLPHEIT